MLQRRIFKYIKDDLDTKMVLLAGPRQCGKTTIAKSLVKEYNGRFYNWDDIEDRKLIMNSVLDFSKDLWAFDELHKYRSWRNWLKGKFDKHVPERKILVTGSAKLDVYSRGGDSLQGRYFLHHLHPLTYAELSGTKLKEDLDTLILMQKDVKDSEALDTLLKLGGFPEPFLSGSERQAKRWRNSYTDRLVREDVRDLENIIQLDKMELLYHHLPLTVGSPLSINSLREDLEVSFDAVKHWLEIFENIYACSRVSPLGGKQILKNIRAVKKEQKLYFWDWALVDNEAARFENLIAMHLLRFCHFIEDIYGMRTELRYFRDTRGHEVDFIILKEAKPWMAVEVKLTEQSLDPNLKYLLERVTIPYAFQVHLKGNSYYQVDDINGAKVSIIPARRFLSNLA
jgi:predicted AAA+ superfamily ATPase